MTTPRFVKQEAFHSVFSNGQLGTIELSDVLYPNRELIIPGFDASLLEKLIYSECLAEVSEVKATIKRNENVIIKDSYRNSLIKKSEDSKFNMIEDIFLLSSMKNRKRKTKGETPALGLINQPFPTIKSRLGELTTIITDIPKPRMPGEKKKIQREEILIPTYNSTQVSEGVVSRPVVSPEGDMEAFTREQKINSVLNSIKSTDLLSQKEGGLTTGELKDKALGLGIKVGNASRELIINSIREMMSKYRLNTQ